MTEGQRCHILDAPEAVTLSRRYLRAGQRLSGVLAKIGTKQMPKVTFLPQNMTVEDTAGYLPCKQPEPLLDGALNFGIPLQTHVRRQL